MKYPRKWENLGEFSRLKVPGGWLVSIEASADGGGSGVAVSMAMCFVPDKPVRTAAESEYISWELEDE